MKAIGYILAVVGILSAVMGAGLSPPQSIPLRPDKLLTPGAILPVSAVDVCVRGYAKKVRNVPASVKRAVYRRYNVDPKGYGAPFEVDHLISLELGGSNAMTNLWPQSYIVRPSMNAHTKDALEDHLHSLVCAHELTLADAQHAIADDWVAAYNRYMPHVLKGDQ